MRLATTALLIGFLGVGLATPAQAAVHFRKTDCPFTASMSLKIIGAQSNGEGTRAEVQWLGQARGGWYLDKQAVVENAGKVYDRLSISKAGRAQTICFDITEFYRKGGR